MAVLENGRPLFFVVVVAQSLESFQNSVTSLLNLGFESEQVIWCNPSQKSRLDIIHQYRKQWLCFLDHDCRLSKTIISVLNRTISSSISGHQVVYAGRYVDSDRCGYLQKTHNFIANTWCDHSFFVTAKVRFFLGGAFLIWNDTDFSKEKFENFWGAEDKYLAYVLQEKNFSTVQLEGFHVEHLTSGALGHFVRRAYLHGLNEKKNPYLRKEKINYLFWLRQFDFSNLHLLPPTLLHFCIQKVGRLIQKIRR